MKFSNYNLFCDKNMAIYNSRSLSVILVNEKDFNILKNESLDKLSELDNLNELIKNGFILDNKINEIEIIKQKYWKQKFLKDILNISIMTTHDCNFACIYCFETRREVYITDETINRIKKFIKGQIEAYNGINIDWYGGEPLMNMSCIMDIGYFTKTLCDNKNKKFSSSVTTNGFLLSNKICNDLKNINVNFLQITLDGPAEIHNNRRFLLDGSSTYETIIENIKNSLNFFKVSLRINVDQTNIGYCNKLIDHISTFTNENLYLGICPVTPKESSTNNAVEDLTIAQQTTNIYKYALNRNINISKLSFFASTTARFCIIDSSSQFIISPEGDLFKCGENFNIEDPGYIGKLTSSGKMVINETKKAFWSKDPFTYNECLDCKILPICMGGCALKRKVKNILPCVPEYKYELNAMLEMYIDLVIKIYEKVN